MENRLAAVADSKARQDSAGGAAKQEYPPSVPVAAGGIRAGTLALVAATIVWGATFLVMDRGIEVFGRALGPGGDQFGPCLYLFLRFALAFVAGCALLGALPWAFTRADWARGGAMAIPMAAGFGLQLYGLGSTTPAVSAFLTSLYVVFTPILDWVVRRVVPPGRVRVGVLLSTAGVFLLTRPWSGFAGVGELLSVLCAIAFAAHILTIDRFTRSGREIEVTMTAIGWTALVFALPLPWFGASGRALDGGFWTTVLGDPWIWLGLPGLVLLATVAVLLVLNRYQKRVSPTRAAVIYTAEPVWALVISALAGGEGRIGPWFLGGAALVLAGNLWAEIGPRQAGPEVPRS